MSILTIVLLSAYLVTAIVFNLAFLYEYKKNPAEEINPVFMKTSIALCSLFWPMLIAITLWQRFKSK